MINLIGIIIIIIVEAVLIASFVAYINNKIEIKDNEITERDHLLAEKTLIIKAKNQRIKELEYEIEARNNKRLRKNH